MSESSSDTESIYSETDIDFTDSDNETYEPEFKKPRMEDPQVITIDSEEESDDSNVEDSSHSESDEESDDSGIEIVSPIESDQDSVEEASDIEPEEVLSPLTPTVITIEDSESEQDDVSVNSDEIISVSSDDSDIIEVNGNEELEQKGGSRKQKKKQPSRRRQKKQEIVDVQRFLKLISSIRKRKQQQQSKRLSSVNKKTPRKPKGVKGRKKSVRTRAVRTKTIRKTKK